MKTLIVLAVALLVTMVTCQDDNEFETEFGPFENSTHRCNFDCSRAVDLALVIDASGSIKDAGSENWDKIINFTIDVIDNFDIGQWGTHVSIITFSTKAIVRVYLNQYMSAEDLKAHIMKNKETWYIGGWTNTYEGLLKMKNEIFTEANGDRPNVPNVAVVVTDGKSSHHERPDKYKDPIPMAREAEAADIQTYVVGVTDNVLESELEGISTAPHHKGETYWTTPHFDTIMEVMKTLLLKTCRAICIPKNMVCNKAIDLAIVVDASGSIQKEEEKYMEPPQNTNWWLIMGFVKNVIDKFTIGENDVRVGIVTFSNMGITRVKLNQYYDPEELKAATNDYRWYGDGRTNTWEGLHKMRTELFSAENGDRENVPNVAIVITDGQSSHTKRPWQYKDPIPEAGLAKLDGVKMFGVGVTKEVNSKELELIASDPPPDMETVFITMDFDSLTNILQPFLESLMGQSCFYE